nr:MAG TPA: hypothetical protein [Caudoviricetes sp.]
MHAPSYIQLIKPHQTFLAVICLHADGNVRIVAAPAIDSS